MSMRTPPMTQERTTQAVEKLYDILPDVGVENTNVSAKKIAGDINLTGNQAERLIKHLETLKILSRRIQFTGKGKESFWKLLVPKEEALRRIGEPQSWSAPPEVTASLKSRIFQAISESDHFDSVYDILLAIRQPGESLDLHSMTNNLFALQQEGKIMFKRDASGRRTRGKGNGSNNLPYDIHLRKHVTTPEIIASHNTAPEPEKETVQESLHEAAAEILSAVNDYSRSPEHIAMAEAMDKALTEPNPIDLPLITRLVNRRLLLEQAAKLAEDAGEDEIAMRLLEKTEASPSPLEQEVMQLWAAYQECKDHS